MRVFYFKVDAACLNASVLLPMRNHQWQDEVIKKHDSRRLFLLKLGEQLVMPVIQSRALTSQIFGRPSVARAMMSMGIQPQVTSTPESKKRGRCIACQRSKENKVTNRCSNCHSFVCGAHSLKTVTYSCITCPQETDDGE